MYYICTLVSNIHAFFQANVLITDNKYYSTGISLLEGLAICLDPIHLQSHKRINDFPMLGARLGQVLSADDGDGVELRNNSRNFITGFHIKDTIF